MAHRNFWKEKIIPLLLAALACAAPSYAQKDFLSTDEVDQLRLVQEPNERLKLYILFARQRMDQVQQLFKTEKPGRSLTIHDLLDEYSKIIDAIDTVSDDALKRRLDIQAGNAAVSTAEKQFLADLNKLEETHPRDYSRYQFSLKQAIDNTSDSLELTQSDLGQRSADVQAKAEQEKTDRDALLTPKERTTKKAAAQAEADDKAKHKPPSLYKPGETKDH